MFLTTLHGCTKAKISSHFTEPALPCSTNTIPAWWSSFMKSYTLQNLTNSRWHTSLWEERPNNSKASNNLWPSSLIKGLITQLQTEFYVAVQGELKTKDHPSPQVFPVILSTLSILCDWLFNIARQGCCSFRPFRPVLPTTKNNNPNWNHRIGKRF